MLALLIAIGFAVYGLYLNNPLIFDDVNLFHSEWLARAAIAPWELGSRGLPYFTLGWVETQFGSLPAHRLVGLAIHILVAFQLYRLLEELLQADRGLSPGTALAGTGDGIVAALVALAFVAHPVAVYGAAYLVQRTTVLAALFTLLCLRCLLQGIRGEQSTASAAIRAAGWASLAILSKEHAIVMPFAALALLVFVNGKPMSFLKLMGSFLALCLPAMMLAMRRSSHAFGRAHEPGLQELGKEVWGLPSLAGPYQTWLFSASTQAELYLRYAGQWLFPDTRQMSIDLRVDFLRDWNHSSAWLALSLFAAVPVTALVLAMWTRRCKLLAFSLSFTAGLFVVELATVRLQEPFVLYRSYLWAVGYAALAAAGLRHLNRKALLLAFAAIIPVLSIQSADRLESMRSRLALWEDAAEKLPKLEIAGAARIFFNRGRARFFAGDVIGAKSDIDQAIRLNPTHGPYRISRAVTLLRMGQPTDALDELDIARQSIPQSADLYYTRFLALTALERTTEAEASLELAALHGSFSAKQRIAARRSSDGIATVEMQ
ncbi:tetratricopeptide repeat protein [Ramlibacter tataouinensis]|uniref:Candidate membrane protein n=1 Tax=Ramlibacter tataouinensis (strain ATCC BAA-407 / DSM 14655 / LMG 21543 / TTB310) TaxID=365046 RepID=F5Y273_RAMTT|nr:membrane protein [Ramlibacter tataouinensis]AEG94841.1 candidate membrane protein [Ramlibacter tataouinensis TTB310]